MEYGSSIYLTKENSFQTQDSWIPVTPTKPKQTNQSAPKQWLNSGAYSNGQENSCENTVGASNSKPGTAMHFNSTAFADREQNLNSWKVATAAQTQVSSLNTYVEALRNAAAQWNKMPYANPLSSTDAMAAASAMHRGRNATTLRSPISYIQTDGSSNQQQLRMNQALMPESNSSSNNRSCCPPQMTQYGFPVPYHTTYNCGFHKKAIADSVTNGTISFQPAPVSPVWGTRVQDNQTVQLTCLSADERASHEKESLTPCVSVTALPKGSVEPYNNQGMLQPVNMLLPAVLPTQMKETYNPSNKEVLCENSLAAALSTPVKENHNPDKGEDQCIDLNKTPQQKPKIKRHRPKVIREDKPKRTPKPVTPNQTISTENPLKKRKYVRRAGPKASITPSENAHEAVDSYDGTGVRSCKRSLNFNLEGKTEGGQPSTTQVHWGKPNRSTSDKFGDASCTRALNLNAETQYFNQYGGISLCFGSKSTLEVAQGLEVVVGNLPAGIAFDLNHSKTQAQDDRISLPGKANSCQTIAKEEPSMEHMKSLAVKRRSMGSIGPCINIHDKGHPHMHQNVHTNDTECRINPSEASRDNLLSIEPPKLQNGLQLINENQYNSNSRLHVLLGKSNNIKRGSKREYNFTVNDTHLHPVNLYATHSIPMQASQQRIIQYNEYYGKSGAQDIHFHENYKKMKTDTRNELTSNMMLPVTVRVNSGSQPTAASVSEVIANQLALQISGGRSMPLCNLMEGNNKPQNGASYKVPDVHSQSMAGKHNRTVPNISREVFSRLNAQREIYLNEPQAPNGMGLGNIEKAMNGRMNRPVQMNELASLTAAAVTCDRLPTTPVKTVLTYNDRQVSNIFCRPQARMKTLVADNYGKLRKKDNTEEVVYLAHHMPSNTSQVHLQEHNAPVYVYHQSRMESRVTTPVQKPIGPTTSSSNHSQPRISQTVPINFIYDYQSSSNTQQTLCASFPFQVIAPCTDPVDEIVQRFKSLNFDDGSKIITAQAKSALVPYGGDGKMVPYKGLFDPTKKRQPRPKVNLDSETDRVWKLLMWKEGNDGTEGTDAEKQKWWEEERHVFRGRADSFIARMHLVQGDRRFSPWKGSVVDSVVGVFLTQNVSDQLSSSAFMALAAKFPLQSRSTEHNGQGKNSSAEEQDVSILETDDSISRQSKILNQKVYDRESMRIQEVDHLEVKEIASSNESFGSNMAACTEEYLKSKHLASCKIGSVVCQESSKTKTDIGFIMTGSSHLTGVEDRKATEDVVPSQVSVISSQNSTESIVQAADTVGPSSESNSEVENLIKRFECDDFDSSTTFMDLLKMEGTKMFNDFYVNGNECIPAIENFYVATNQLKGAGYGKRISYDGEDHPKVSSPSNSNTSTHCLQTQQEYKGIPSIHSNGYHLHIGPRSDPAQLESMEASGEKNGSYLPSAASRITEIKDDCFTGKMKNAAAEYKIDNALQRNPCFNAQTTLKGYSSIPLTKHSLHPPPTSDAIPNTHFDVAECSNLVDKQTVKVRNVAEPIRKDEVYNSKNVHTRPTKNDLKGKRGMSRADKKRVFDWDSLRKNAFLNAPKRESSINTMDSVDWEAVRRADVSEISNAIRERGMNNMLSERIKDFLNRLVKEHGSINLEWLRDVPPDKAKDYLLSIRGLGLKSTECVRLLTLHHLAFPVDTNVGRMCVRLGWVPLQPLPESLQLHLLELYPQLETVQKYLWPRLCTLDQRTLYELHYQMITFGKVFCTKHKPNCNACPMRGECKHFASAFASARLALPGPEEKRLVASAVPSTTEHGKLVINPMPLPQPENPHLQAGSRTIQCEPIIEEPVTPEPEYIDTLERAIEDAFWMDDPDEIPTIKLNFEEFTQNVQNYIQGNAELQDDDMSKALVALTQEAASIPMPKLKNTSRLRTEHQVYELPDSHPLLAKLDRREPDDPCPYLLAIWTPGETAQSIRPPEKLCNSQKSGNLCSKKTCFACNSIREENAQTVRGTLLIPCRTAMRGSFPLNGTYFQVNEVFADDESSIHPIDVPRAWIWNLPRRTVYFGTSISTIFKGLTTEGIQQCFWRGFICVRGFDQKTQAPRPLTARLHFPASKLVRTKKTLAESEQA